MDLLTSSGPGEVASKNQLIHQMLDNVLALTEDLMRFKNISVRKDYAAIDFKIFMNKQEMKKNTLSSAINRNNLNVINYHDNAK